MKNKSKISKYLRNKIKIRSRNKCEYMDKKGRCSATTGLSMHHIIHRVDGGKNSTKNIVHICNYHRKLMHGIIKEK